MMTPDALSTGSSARSGFDAARLIMEHQAGVWRYLRLLGCSANEAEDLTQETFLAVLEKPFHDYDRHATAGYLRQVARNLLVSARRRTHRGLPMSSTVLNDLDMAWSRWASRDNGEELLAALQKCLETLAAKARQALDLRYRERATRAGIAAALGISEDGAKNMLQRAKQHLRGCIEKTLA